MCGRGNPTIHIRQQTNHGNVVQNLARRSRLLCADCGRLRRRGPRAGFARYPAANSQILRFTGHHDQTENRDHVRFKFELISII